MTRQPRMAFCVRGLFLVSLGVCVAHGSHAGAQREEELSHAVRTALSAAVSEASPPEPVLHDEAERRAYQHWFDQLQRHLSRWEKETLVRQDIAQTVWYESRRAGLAPSLVLGLVQVESAFRKHAISSAGARGYMQVMPFWARLIADGDEAKLFHLQTNIRMGCVILRHYLLLEKGNLFLALGRYNGSRGQAPYPQAVFKAQAHWHRILGPGVG